MSRYYAVQHGRNQGVYESWSDCRQQVDGYSGARFQKFSSVADAQQFAYGAAAGSGYNQQSRYDPGT